MNALLSHRHYLVLGLGASGLSAARWLHAQGAQVRVADNREHAPGLAALQQDLPSIEVVLGEFDARLLHGVQCVVISPGLSLQLPIVQAAQQAHLPVIGDVELFAQACPPTVKRIGITGSNGKTTVTSMVGEICRAAGWHTIVAGNIGLPVLDALAQIGETPSNCVMVLELSSFQLETTHTLALDAAAMLNLSADHLDRHGDMATYAAAKQRIFAHSQLQVLNRDDDASVAMHDPAQASLYFSARAPQHANEYGLHQRDGVTVLMRGEQALMTVNELKLAGLHNACNALAAIALCEAIGIETAVSVAALRQFKGLPHRVEWVANIAGVDFYDDSKGTNVGATCAALQGLAQRDGRVVLIAGGDGKGQDFSPLSSALSASARAAVLIGRDAAQIAKVIPSDCTMQFAADLTLAVDQAFALAQKQDCVLLSPACASFDMFKDYQHRAQVYVAAVQQLAQQQAQQGVRA